MILYDIIATCEMKFKTLLYKSDIYFKISKKFQILFFFRKKKRFPSCFESNFLKKCRLR